MLCKNPYVQGAQAFGCGQCLPCRINRRRVWAHRIMLEAQKHGDSAFLTLTYRPENLPPDGGLSPRDVTLWLKKLRKKNKVRYFLVGEYGETTFRPHYHVALFGFPSCMRGRTDHRLRSCCEQCSRVRDTWELGEVDLGQLNFETAQYIGGYVTKKMTKANDERLNGRHPEFARMSLKPGLGAAAMEDVASVLLTDGVTEGWVSQGDVPSVLSYGKKKFPLGRYLKKRLRIEVGMPDATPKKIQDALKAEMLLVFRDALKDEKNTSSSLKNILTTKNSSAIKQMETRYKIYEKRRPL